MLASFEIFLCVDNRKLTVFRFEYYIARTASIYISILKIFVWPYCMAFDMVLEKRSHDECITHSFLKCGLIRVQRAMLFIIRVAGIINQDWNYNQISDFIEEKPLRSDKRVKNTESFAWIAIVSLRLLSVRILFYLTWKFTLICYLPYIFYRLSLILLITLRIGAFISVRIILHTKLVQFWQMSMWTLQLQFNLISVS